MKRGSEIGITPIKGINVRNSCKEIEEILYDINDKLYFFSTLYISNKVKNYILEEIEKAGNKLKNLSLPLASKSIEKKKEIINKLRESYVKIREYNDYDSIKDNMSKEEKMSAYFVARFIKDKNEGLLTVEKRLKWIKDIKFYSNFYCISSSLESVQKELLDYFLVKKSF